MLSADKDNSDRKQTSNMLLSENFSRFLLKAFFVVGVMAES